MNMDIATGKISIDLGDGRKLVAYPYADENAYKEIWVDVEDKDGASTPVAIIGCQAGVPIREFTARLWAGKETEDGTEWSHEIHIEHMEASEDE